jgi:hypothetical protein
MPSQPRTAAHPLSPAARSDPRRAAALVALSLAFGLIQLDASIVNVALGVLRADLGGGVATTRWVVDGYTLPLAAAMPTAGALGDVIGHRRVCMTGIVVFGVASLGCGVAPGPLTLIIATRSTDTSASRSRPWVARWRNSVSLDAPRPIWTPQRASWPGMRPVTM